MKDLLKQFYVIGFRFKIGFHFIRVWASIFSLTFNSMMKGFFSLKRIKGLAGTWRLTLDKTGETRLKWLLGYVEEPPGVPLGNLGGGVPPRSPNPDPI